MLAMKPQNNPRWQLMGVSLLMVFALGACSGSKTETASLEASVAKLTAQVADLTKKTDDLAETIRKDQVAKNARFGAIENDIEDITSRLKK
jgi:cell division protein FtsB